jgi:hypothetical protein
MAKPSHEVPPEQVDEVSKHVVRQNVAALVAKKYDNLADRVAVFKQIAAYLPAEKSGPDFSSAVESRPELDAMGRWGRRSENADDSRRHAIQQAEALIASNLRPINYEDFQRDSLSTSPGPGITVLRPRAINW